MYIQKIIYSNTRGFSHDSEPLLLTCLSLKLCVLGVSSQFEDQYPPIFLEPTPNTAHIAEGNYTGTCINITNKTNFPFSKNLNENKLLQVS